MAAAAADVFEIIGALQTDERLSAPDDLDVMTRFQERVLAAVELNIGRIVDAADWARLADDNLLAQGDGDWDPDLMRALRELPSRAAGFAAARTGSEQAFGEAARRYIPDAYRAALYFLTRTRDTERAVALLRDLDHAVAMAADRLGPATPAPADRFGPAAPAAAAGLSLYQLRMDIHQAIAAAGGATASAMRTAARRGLAENFLLPRMVQRTVDDLGVLAWYGSETPSAIRPYYTAHRVASEGLFDDRSARLPTGRTLAIGVHAGHFVAASGSKTEHLTTGSGGISFVMDRWGRMMAGDDHDALLRLMSVMGDELAGWGTLATDDYGRPDGPVRSYRARELFDPMGTAQLRDVLARGGLRLDDSTFDNESQGRFWRGDPPPIPQLFDMDAVGFHNSIEALFAGYGEHFWVKADRDTIALSRNEIRIPLTLAPLRREPGHLEVVAQRQGTRTILRYRDPHPGAEPEQVAPVFAELHRRMTRWAAESGTVDWHPDTAEVVRTFEQHLDRARPDQNGTHIGSRPTDSTPDPGDSVRTSAWPNPAEVKPFGSWLRAARTALGISLRELAARMGVPGSATYLASFERGIRPTRDMMSRILSALAVPEEIAGAVLREADAAQIDNMPDPTAPTFTIPNAWIAAARVRRKMSQKDLAAHVGLSVTQWAPRERATIARTKAFQITWEQAQRALEALGVTQSVADAFRRRFYPETLAAEDDPGETGDFIGGRPTDSTPEPGEQVRNVVSWPDPAEVKPFAAWLRAARAALGISRDELAARMGAPGSGTYIGSFERVITPTRDMTVRILEALGAPEDIAEAVLRESMPAEVDALPDPTEPRYPSPNSWIVAARLRRKMSQKEMAAHVGLSVTQWAPRERAENPRTRAYQVTGEQAQRALEALGATARVTDAFMRRFYPDSVSESSPDDDNLSGLIGNRPDEQSDHPFRILDDPGMSGDREVEPGYWGHYGAAGVLVRTFDEDGEEVFLVCRSKAGFSQGNFQLPGGALCARETPAQGAAREMNEELGADAEYLAGLAHRGTHVIGGPRGWKYHVLVADAPQRFDPVADGTETADARWVTRAELAAMARRGEVHSALTRHLPRVLGLFDPEADVPDVPTAAEPETAAVERPDRPAYRILDRELFDSYVQLKIFGSATFDDPSRLLEVQQRNEQFFARYPQARELAVSGHLVQYERVLQYTAELARELGLSVGALSETLTRELTDLVEGKPLAIRMRQEALFGLLADGRFKTQFEGMLGGGRAGEVARMEDRWFGNPEDMDPRLRPVYGLVLVDGERPAGLSDAATSAGLADIRTTLYTEKAAMYGRIEVVLKDDVRQRATFCVGDSLVYSGSQFDGKPARTMPSPLLDPRPESFGVVPLSANVAVDDHALRGIERDYSGALFRRHQFVESHIHGGVTLSDIDHINLPEPPDPELRAALDDAGIPWRVLDSHAVARSGDAEAIARERRRLTEDRAMVEARVDDLRREIDAAGWPGAPRQIRERVETVRVELRNAEAMRDRIDDMLASLDPDSSERIGSRPFDGAADGTGPEAASRYDLPDGLSLTRGEAEIFTLARNGLTHSDIAAALGMPERAVSAALSTVRRKLAQRRAQLVAESRLADPSVTSESGRFRSAMYAALVGADQPDPRRLIAEASAEQLERLVSPVRSAREKTRGAMIHTMTLLAAQRSVQALADEYHRTQMESAAALAQASPDDLQAALDELDPVERRIVINQFGPETSPATFEPEGSVRGSRAVDIVRRLAASIADRAGTSAEGPASDLLTPVRKTNHAIAQTYTTNECLAAVAELGDLRDSDRTPENESASWRSLPVDHGFDEEQRRIADEALRAGGFDHAGGLQRWRNRRHTASAQRRATENGEWWDSLRDPAAPGGLSATQRALIQVYPHEIGNADGLPAVIRDHANRLSIRRQLDEFVARKPAGTGMLDWVRNVLTVVERKRFDNLVHIRNHLRQMDRQAAETPGGPPVHLLSFDAAAFGGKGKAVAALGNVDTAHTVNWHVPGTNTTSASLAYQFEPLHNLYKETLRVEPSLELASIIWIGYDAPAGPVNTGFVKAAFRRRARVGGDRLACDIAALHATRRRAGIADPDRLVNRLYGHSYGAVTLSYAGRDGRLAGLIDSVILAGSPGTGPIHHAEEFGIGADKVYIFASWRDVVTKFGADEPGAHSRLHPRLGHGIDPATEAFGGVRLGAEFPSDWVGVETVHQGYLHYDESTGLPHEALVHAAHITAGRGATRERVPHRTAGSRTFGGVSDPENGRYTELVLSARSPEESGPDETDPAARLAVAHHATERRAELLRELSELLAPESIDPAELLRTGSPTWETWFARYREVRRDLAGMLEIGRGAAVDDQWLRHVLDDWREQDCATPEILASGREFDRMLPVAKLVDDIQRLDTWARTVEAVETELARRGAELSGLIGRAHGLLRAATDFRAHGELVGVLGATLATADRLAAERQRLERHARALFALGTAVAEDERASFESWNRRILEAARPYRVSSLDSWHGMTLLHARLRSLEAAARDPEHELSADIEELRLLAERAKTAVERYDTTHLLNADLDAALELANRALTGVPAATDGATWQLSQFPDRAPFVDTLAAVRDDVAHRRQRTVVALRDDPRGEDEIARASERLGRIDTVTAAFDEAAHRRTLGRVQLIRRMHEHLLRYPLDRRMDRGALEPELAIILETCRLSAAALPDDGWAERTTAQVRRQVDEWRRDGKPAQQVQQGERYLSLRLLAEAFEDDNPWNTWYLRLTDHEAALTQLVHGRLTAEDERATAYSRLRELAASGEVDLSRWRSLPELREALDRMVKEELRWLGSVLGAETPEPLRRLIEAPGDPAPVSAVQAAVVEVFPLLAARRPEDLAVRDRADHCLVLTTMVQAAEQIDDGTTELDKFDADLDDWLDEVMDTVGRAGGLAIEPDESDGTIGARPSDSEHGAPGAFSPGMSAAEVHAAVAGTWTDPQGAPADLPPELTNVAALLVDYALQVSGKDGVRITSTTTSTGLAYTVRGSVEGLYVPASYKPLVDNWGGELFGDFEWTDRGDGSAPTWSARLWGDRKRFKRLSATLPAQLAESIPGFTAQQTVSVLAEALQVAASRKGVGRGGGLGLESGEGRLRVRVGDGAAFLMGTPGVYTRTIDPDGPPDSIGSRPHEVSPDKPSDVGEDRIGSTPFGDPGGIPPIERIERLRGRPGVRMDLLTFSDEHRYQAVRETYTYVEHAVAEWATALLARAMGAPVGEVRMEPPEYHVLYRDRAPVRWGQGDPQVADRLGIFHAVTGQTSPFSEVFVRRDGRRAVWLDHHVPRQTVVDIGWNVNALGDLLWSLPFPDRLVSRMLEIQETAMYELRNVAAHAEHPLLAAGLDDRTQAKRRLVETFKLNHPYVEVTGFDSRYASKEAVEEILRRLGQLLDKYRYTPGFQRLMTNIRALRTDILLGARAETSSRNDGDADAGEGAVLLFNLQYAIDRRIASGSSLIEESHGVHPSSGQPYADDVLHEFVHAIDFASHLELSGNLPAVLRDAHTKLKQNGLIESYEEWLRRLPLGAYASPSMSPESAAEALAVGFSAAEIKGTYVGTPQWVIHEYVTNLQPPEINWNTRIGAEVDYSDPTDLIGSRPADSVGSRAEHPEFHWLAARLGTLARFFTLAGCPELRGYTGKLTTDLLPLSQRLDELADEIRGQGFGDWYERIRDQLTGWLAENAPVLHHRNSYAAADGIDRQGARVGVTGEVSAVGTLRIVMKTAEGTPRGAVMFGDLWGEVGDVVHGIEGTWASAGRGLADNLDTFNAGLRSGLTPEDAARATFTGKMAARRGFTEVLVGHLIGDSGDYVLAQVTFVRPARLWEARCRALAHVAGVRFPELLDRVGWSAELARLRAAHPAGEHGDLETLSAQVARLTDWVARWWADQDAHDHPGVAAAVAEVLRRNPGARQLTAHTVLLPGNSVVVVADEGRHDDALTDMLLRHLDVRAALRSTGYTVRRVKPVVDRGDSGSSVRVVELGVARVDAVRRGSDDPAAARRRRLLEQARSQLHPLLAGDTGFGVMAEHFRRLDWPERAELVRDRYDLTSRLAGVPSRWRNRAGRARLAAELERLPGARRSANLETLAAAVARAEQRAATMPGRPDVYLWAFDAETGYAVLTFGDPELVTRGDDIDVHVVDDFARLGTEVDRVADAFSGHSRTGADHDRAAVLIVGHGTPGVTAPPDAPGIPAGLADMSATRDFYQRAAARAGMDRSGLVRLLEGARRDVASEMLRLVDLVLPGHPVRFVAGASIEEFSAGMPAAEFAARAGADWSVVFDSPDQVAPHLAVRPGAVAVLAVRNPHPADGNGNDLVMVRNVGDGRLVQIEPDDANAGRVEAGAAAAAMLTRDWPPFDPAAWSGRWDKGFGIVLDADGPDRPLLGGESAGVRGEDYPDGLIGARPSNGESEGTRRQIEHTHSWWTDLPDDVLPPNQEVADFAARHGYTWSQATMVWDYRDELGTLPGIPTAARRQANEWAAQSATSPDARLIAALPGIPESGVPAPAQTLRHAEFAAGEYEFVLGEDPEWADKVVYLALDRAADPAAEYFVTAAELARRIRQLTPDLRVSVVAWRRGPEGDDAESQRTRGLLLRRQILADNHYRRLVNPTPADVTVAAAGTGCLAATATGLSPADGVHAVVLADPRPGAGSLAASNAGAPVRILSSEPTGEWLSAGAAAALFRAASPGESSAQARERGRANSAVASEFVHPDGDSADWAQLPELLGDVDGMPANVRSGINDAKISRVMRSEGPDSVATLVADAVTMSRTWADEHDIVLPHTYSAAISDPDRADVTLSFGDLGTQLPLSEDLADLLPSGRPARKVLTFVFDVTDDPATLAAQAVAAAARFAWARHRYGDHQVAMLAHLRFRRSGADDTESSEELARRLVRGLDALQGARKRPATLWVEGSGQTGPIVAEMIRADADEPAGEAVVAAAHDDSGVSDDPGARMAEVLPELWQWELRYREAAERLDRELAGDSVAARRDALRQRRDHASDLARGIAAAVTRYVEAQQLHEAAKSRTPAESLSGATGPADLTRHNARVTELIRASRQHHNLAYRLLVLHQAHTDLAALESFHDHRLPTDPQLSLDCSDPEIHAMAAAPDPVHDDRTRPEPERLDRAFGEPDTSGLFPLPFGLAEDPAHGHPDRMRWLRMRQLLTDLRVGEYGLSEDALFAHVEAHHTALRQLRAVLRDHFGYPAAPGGPEDLIGSRPTEDHELSWRAEMLLAAGALGVDPGFAAPDTGGRRQLEQLRDGELLEFSRERRAAGDPRLAGDPDAVLTAEEMETTLAHLDSDPLATGQQHAVGRRWRNAHRLLTATDELDRPTGIAPPDEGVLDRLATAIELWRTATGAESYREANSPAYYPEYVATSLGEVDANTCRAVLHRYDEVDRALQALGHAWNERRDGSGSAAVLDAFTGGVWQHVFTELEPATLHTLPAAIDTVATAVRPFVYGLDELPMAMLRAYALLDLERRFLYKLVPSLRARADRPDDSPASTDHIGGTPSSDDHGSIGARPWPERVAAGWHPSDDRGTEPRGRGGAPDVGWLTFVLGPLARHFDVSGDRAALADRAEDTLATDLLPLWHHLGALAAEFENRGLGQWYERTMLDLTGRIVSTPVGRYRNLYAAAPGDMDDRYYPVGARGEVDLSGKLLSVFMTGPGTPSGGAMFEDVWRELGDIVHGITDYWARERFGLTDNLDSFNAAVRSGLSPEDAARTATFTGKMAHRRGFTEVVIDVLEGEPGNYDRVELTYVRPSRLREVRCHTLGHQAGVRHPELLNRAGWTAEIARLREHAARELRSKRRVAAGAGLGAEAWASAAAATEARIGIIERLAEETARWWAEQDARDHAAVATVAADLLRRRPGTVRVAPGVVLLPGHTVAVIAEEGHHDDALTDMLLRNPALRAGLRSAGYDVLRLKPVVQQDNWGNTHVWAEELGTTRAGNGSVGLIGERGRPTPWNRRQAGSESRPVSRESENGEGHIGSRPTPWSAAGNDEAIGARPHDATDSSGGEAVPHPHGYDRGEDWLGALRVALPHLHEEIDAILESPAGASNAIGELRALMRREPAVRRLYAALAQHFFPALATVRGPVVGAGLRFFREQAGLRPGEFAHRLGVLEVTVAHRESSERLPPATTAWQAHLRALAAGTGPVDDSVEIGACLGVLRARVGLPVRYVAEKLGVSAEDVADIEAGRRRPERADAEAYLRALTPGKPRFPEGYRHTGEFLRFLRNDAGVSLAEAARRAGMSKAMVVNRESGRVPLTPEFVELYLREYGQGAVSSAEIAELSGAPTPAPPPRTGVAPLEWIFPSVAGTSSLGEYMAVFQRENGLTTGVTNDLFGYHRVRQDESRAVREVTALRAYDRFLFQAGPWNSFAEAWGYTYRMDPEGEHSP
ncbi:helix-turn-helix domain-containing protein [Nocardia wallacei]|uniref:helix-turn-helix domain-containing protein n=1 Tax=Nocardia wallacei TaxID=480035 RepID=UPI0024555DBF|nr:helix-turn-helix domain-containing protein [Nocardia wallacei]